MEDFLLTLLSNYLFPIVACVALFVKMDKDEKARREDNAELLAAHREELHQITLAHAEETSSLREALENNTAIMIRLEASLRTRDQI